MAKFSDLPEELRDITWELAGRPQVPGAHVFTVHHMELDSHIAESPWPVKISTEISDDVIPGASLAGFAAPLCGQDGTFPWTRGNPLTYKEGLVLWMTDRGSRRYMLGRFRPAETSRRIIWQLPVTAVLQNNSGERQNSNTTKESFHYYPDSSKLMYLMGS